MVRFQLHDAVVLRDDRRFVGSIDRVSGTQAEALQDILIIAHTHVPPDVLEKFVETGDPPSGYVFVQFAEQEQGSSLVSEDDLVLLDRLFEIGDRVKFPHGELLGHVQNVSNTYTIEPIWRAIISSDFGARPSLADTTEPLPPISCSTSCNTKPPHVDHPRPHFLIPNVPFEELKRAQDYYEGDHVLLNDWLGMVDSVELSIVIKLENNSVVAVADADELFIPIPDYNKPLVALPEFDGIPRPSVITSLQGWSATIPPETLECGQFVITNEQNIRSGRWLRGSFEKGVKPEGHVLMVRCRRLGIQWIAPNALSPDDEDHPRNSELSPYENIDLFQAPQELRRAKHLVLYDPSKQPRQVQDRTRSRSSTRPTDHIAHVNLSSSFTMGNRVRFRDAAGAAVKYTGHEHDGRTYGCFERIPHQNTFGYDLNDLRIVHSTQMATVRWQDGSITTCPSTDLAAFIVFEQDHFPGDLVVAREGLKQRRSLCREETASLSSTNPIVDFDEMKMLEKAHDLYPAKVGIIQTVNTSERVARVRWYVRPSVILIMNGSALGAASRFGRLSDEVDDVSLYEIMAFPGLQRDLRDLVMIVPESPSKRILEVTDFQNISNDDRLYTPVINLEQRTRGQSDLLSLMHHIVRVLAEGTGLTAPMDPAQYKPHKSTDWFGEICRLGLDGTVLVRVNNQDKALDLVIEHDQFVCFVGSHAWLLDMNDDGMDLDDEDELDDESDEYSDYSDGSNTPISEHVEYEGGQRVDDDSGDENWESEDDDMYSTGTPPKPEDISMEDASAVVAPAESVTHAPHPIGVHLMGGMEPATQSQAVEDNHKQINTFLPESEPDAFSVLECEPPLDQYGQSEPHSMLPTTHQAFLKRIAKEHRILSTSLPRHEIYVRTYENRLDLMRCLILGPADTPYEYAPLLVDLHLGLGFPRHPPTAHFHSWSSGLGRINPNLYEEGKICLSLLGTWHSKGSTESWSEKATILQLLVSLQGLVLVRRPFFNEAGFEGYEDDPQYLRESLQYSEKAFLMARNFVKHALTRPVAGLEDVLAWSYLKKGAAGHGILRKVIDRAESLIKRSKEIGEGGNEGDKLQLLNGDGSKTNDTESFLRPLSQGAVVMLNKTLGTLKNINLEATVDAAI